MRNHDLVSDGFLALIAAGLVVRGSMPCGPINRTVSTRSSKRTA